MKKSRLSFTKLFQESKNLLKEQQRSARTTGRGNSAGSRETDRLAPSDPASETDNSLCDGCWTEEMAETLYELASKYLKEVFLLLKAQKKFSLEKGFEIIKKFVEVNAPNDALFIKSIHDDKPLDYVIHHSVNVAIYSVALAKSLGLSVERQIEVGMAALLHEVGMGFIPEEIVFKKTPLSDEEFRKLKERPDIGYKILRSFGDEYAYLAETAQQANERIDGSGYPAGLKGDEINEYAQIIGLTAVYEALIHSRPQRVRFLHFTAVKEIIRTGKNRFQRRHLKALLSLFSIFPISSYVVLNSGAVGRVVETYSQHPMRPRVEIVYDSQQRPVLTERIINLPENPLLYIVDSVSDQDINLTAS